MYKIGSYNDLVVERIVEFGAYLNPRESEILLPLKYVPKNTRPGDTLRVFVYHDSEDRPVATTRTPKAVVGEFAHLRVTDATAFGVFMDWGLEKDLLVPKSEQQGRMKIGQKFVVKVCLDEKTGRVYGSSRITQHCKPAPAGPLIGKRVDLLIYGTTKIGILAVVDNLYSGMLYRSETFESLAIGDKRTGYITRIREDGKLDLSLKNPGYRSISGSADKVLEILEKQGGAVACHDKTPPDEIRRIFSMSKKEFKRAIGGLYKRGKIKITEQGIRLKGPKIKKGK